MSNDNPVWSGMQPSVVWDPDNTRFELFYNGDSDEEKGAAPSTFNPSVAVSHATSVDGDAFQASSPLHVLDWDPSLDYEEYGWLTGADAVLRPDGYWLYYTGFSSVNPPQNFYVPANEGWCADAGVTCTCYDDNGTQVCLLPTVMTLNLARKQR